LMRKLEGDEAYANSQIESLGSALAEVREEELKFAQNAQQERDRAFAMGMTGAIVGGLANVASFGTASALGTVAVSIASASQSHDGKEGARAAAAPVLDVRQIQDQAREAAAHLRQLKKELDLFKQTPEAETDEGKDKIKQMEAQYREGTDEGKAYAAQFQQASAQNAANAVSLDAKEAAATARKRELQNIHRDQRARLKQSVKEMEGMTVHKTAIEQALKCLSVTLQTMGRVKTTFSTVELFWRAVAEQCKQLGAMKDELGKVWEIADEDEKELDPFDVIKEGFQQSAVQWAALGLVNHKAHSKMVEAMDGINAKMCALPNGNIDSSLVDSLVRNLTASLEEDERMLQD